MKAIAAGLWGSVRPPEGRTFTSAERFTSLADIVSAIVHERGAWKPADDALHDAVIAHCTTDRERAYWSGDRCGEIIGLLRHQPEVQTLLAARDVVAFFDEERDLDRQVRLVSTTWRKTHEGIWAHVVDPDVSGAVCRFCRIPESETLLLEVLDAPPRTKLERPSCVRCSTEPGASRRKRYSRRTCRCGNSMSMPSIWLGGFCFWSRVPSGSWTRRTRA